MYIWEFYELSCYFNLKFIKYHIYIYLGEKIYASHIASRDLFEIKNKKPELNIHTVRPLFSNGTNRNYLVPIGIQ